MQWFPVLGVVLLTIVLILGLLAARRRTRPVEWRHNPVDALIQAGAITDDEHAAAWRDYLNSPIGSSEPPPPPIPFQRFHGGGFIHEGIRGEDEVLALLSRQRLITINKYVMPELRNKDSQRPHSPADAANGPDSGTGQQQSGVRPTFVGIATQEIGERGDECRLSDQEARALRDDYREQHVNIAGLWDEDAGEPLSSPPQPNIGGEGNPEYRGPHYDVPHGRFVPYDLLRDPNPGEAVFAVGNAAFTIIPRREEGEQPESDRNVE
jgi:hypothetical protein